MPVASTQCGEMLRGVVSHLRSAGRMLRTHISTFVLRCPFPGVQAISAHFLWLSFLTEQWAIISRLRDARTAAARVMYGRLLAASLQDPAVLSHHPAAVGAYFRLLTLGLKYGRSCLRGGPATAGKDVLLLFDRILQAVSRCLRLFGAETAGHCRAAGTVLRQALHCMLQTHHAVPAYA